MVALNKPFGEDINSELFYIIKLDENGIGLNYVSALNTKTGVVERVLTVFGNQLTAEAYIQSNKLEGPVLYKART